MARTQERVDIRILPLAALTAKEWDEIWELTQIYVETQLEFWPRYDRPTPDRQAALIEHLAQNRYGTAWRPGQGIVERSGRKKLKPATAAVEPKVLADPNIRFFVTTNPGHQEGDMLVCLCPLTLKNWWYAAGKAIRRRFQP